MPSGVVDLEVSRSRKSFNQFSPGVLCRTFRNLRAKFCSLALECLQIVMTCESRVAFNIFCGKRNQCLQRSSPMRPNMSEKAFKINQRHIWLLGLVIRFNQGYEHISVARIYVAAFHQCSL